MTPETNGSLTVINFLTALLVVITAIYVWVTHRILKANEKVVSVMQAQHDSATRPYITIRPFTEPGNPILLLEVRNTGLTAASNLRLTLDKDFYPFGEKIQGKSLATANAFQYPIASFAPSAVLSFYLATGPDIFSEKANPDLTPQTFRVTAEYSYAGKTVKEETTIDLKQFLGTRLDEMPIVHELKEIRKALEGITSTLKNRKE